MRGLKTAVIVMGVMLVVGFALLVAAITYRLSHPRDTHASAAAPPTTGKPFTAPPVDLPAGAKIEAVSVGADRLVLNLTLPDGNRQLLVLDLGSGRPLTSIPLRAVP